MRRYAYWPAEANYKTMDKLELKGILKSHFSSLENESLNAFVKHSSYLKSTKGTKLISEGRRHHYFYLIIEGGVKSYYSRDSRDVCMWFAFENEAIGTMTTYEGLPSKETVELLEDSELIKFNIEKIKELTRTDLSISHLINDLIIEHTLCIEERLYQLQFTTSEERYKSIIQTTPEILQKVSLTDIASYLGVSRETLSRIRSK
jgi:CRP-like cAMP-binding protein|tara:strand:+ start:4708 stop:5319 length:612 start_codon:yes stop_codon:yes gene_type:complete